MLQSNIPYTRLCGQPTDISTLCESEWYEWVIYRVEGQQFPYNHNKLGQLLGPATYTVSAISQWVLTGTSDIIPIQTLGELTPAEYNSHSIKERMEEFTKVIKKTQ